MHIPQAVLLCAAQLLGGAPTDQDTYRLWSLPQWVQQALGEPAFSRTYELHFGVNPFYQRGDFDGDNAMDVAVLIRQRGTRKIGIAFVHQGSKRWHIVGAGSPLGNGGDDFSWLGVWRVEPGTALKERTGFRPEVLFVERPESASALLFWNGKQYEWVQRAD